METYEIILLCLGGLLMITIVTIAVLALRNKRLHDGQGDRAEDIKIVDGVRYSRSDVIIDKNGGSKISLCEGDFVLAQGTTVRAETDGDFLPGTYTVLSASEAVPVFKLRLGGYVREYKHGDVVVVGDGERVTAVSCTVIFR